MNRREVVVHALAVGMAGAGPVLVAAYWTSGVVVTLAAPFLPVEPGTTWTDGPVLVLAGFGLSHLHLEAVHRAPGAWTSTPSWWRVPRFRSCLAAGIVLSLLVLLASGVTP